MTGNSAGKAFATAEAEGPVRGSYTLTYGGTHDVRDAKQHNSSIDDGDARYA